MNLLRLTDLGGGQIQISWQRANGAARSYPQPLPFADPLSPQDRQDLHWYLEEFLQFPYGAERWRAEQVEKKMAKWGAALFTKAFPKGDHDPDPRAFYQEAVREGLDQCDLCITSEDPAFLNIPWETTTAGDPGSPGEG